MQWAEILIEMLTRGANVPLTTDGNSKTAAAKLALQARLMAWSGIVTIILGLGLLVYAISDTRSILGSAGWPNVPGSIVESRGTEATDRYGTHYLYIIRYQYNVGGKLRSGKRISFNSTSRSPQELVKSYPIGSTVTVYYDPDDPGNAVLDPLRGPADWVSPALIGTAPLGLGFLVLMGARAKRRQAANAALGIFC